MKFRVTKIAAAVAVSLGTVVSTNVARADEIFFPYIVNSATVTTILSVINEDQNANTKKLHYRYYYKQNNNTESCQEVDYTEPTSNNDVVTFDTGGVYGDPKTGVLFEPAASQKNAVYDTSRTFAVFKNVKPSIANGIVDNNGSFLTTFVVGGKLKGEALVIEFLTGSAWGYSAYSPSRIYALQGDGIGIVDAYDFSDRVANNGEVLVAPPLADVIAGNINQDNYWVPISIFPFPTLNTDNTQAGVQTRLFVTPIATTSPYQIPAGGNAIPATIALAVQDPGNAQLDVAYDRDENPISGRVPQPVVCVGRVEVQSLISSAALQFLTAGGWSNVAVTAGQATVIDLQFNPSSPSTLEVDGQKIGGSFNNAVWLRKGIRQSLPRNVTLLGNDQQPFMPVFQVGSSDVRSIDRNSPYPVLASRAEISKLPLVIGQTLPAGGQVSVADATRLSNVFYNTALFAPLSAVDTAIAKGQSSGVQ